MEVTPCDGQVYTSALLNLPTEVLFKIVQEPGTDQATIAQVSRRLNSIITHLFLSSRGITFIGNPIPSLSIHANLNYIDDGNENHSATRDTYWGGLNEDLSILATALDITAVTHLSCTLKVSHFFDQAYLIRYKTEYT
ncbi:hypothetical protein BDN72DRAFT_961303 [Pluteus cervinus]|uniref:Uncharacterized protein n=1 Tax=Pluteus cervinus TaxID=181527 RepID=A0ACD3AME5_9AGAR|nr:hypothetical protein BDN72DRAFT_961303 [Pluteus cervinus]